MCVSGSLFLVPLGRTLWILDCDVRTPPGPLLAHQALRLHNAPDPHPWMCLSGFLYGAAPGSTEPHPYEP